MADPHWVLVNAQPLINSIGILFDIVGAWLVAWEVVREYKGQKHEVSTGIAMGEFVVGQKVKETKQLQAWERNQFVKMKTGLVLLTLGFMLQPISNWVK